ncbi:MAG: nucleotide exchange factor GrpE, partial [Flavobacteriales bacterium]
MNTEEVNNPEIEEPQDQAPETDTPKEAEAAHEAGEAEAQAEEATDWQDKYLRLYAEFDNFRKRTMRERGELVRSAGRDVMEALLPVLDDFERALAAGEG